MASLRVVSGQLAGTTIEITDELLIGRADAGLTLDDNAVSRRHAIVRDVGGVLEIEDLGSSNGTFVEGVRIEAPTRLGDGAKVTVGTTELVVEHARAAETVPAARDPRATQPAAPAAPPAETSEPLAPAPERGPPARRGRPSRKLVVPLALAALAAIALLGYFLTSDDDSKETSFVDVAVRFTVRDLNRSVFKCGAKPTGRPHTITGRLVSPAEVSPSATLYVSGVIFSALFEFHNDLVSEYDFIGRMASLGHTSIVIDRVGYGGSRPYPVDGRRDCLGTHADMLHQVVEAMRAGDYEIVGSDRRPTEFDRIALGGYSIGALISEIEIVSFDDVQALMVMGWAHQDFTANIAGPQYIQKNCFPGSPKSPGGLRGYFHTLEADKVRMLVSKRADPKIVASFASRQVPDACGQFLDFGKWFAGLNQRVIGQIRLPVLIVFGYYDLLFQFSAWQKEWDRFVGTADRTLVGIPDGQMVMLDDHSAMTARMMSAWLARRGF